MNVFLRKKSLVWQKITLFIILILIIIGGLNIFKLQVKNTFYTVTSPIQKVLWKTGESTHNFFFSLFAFQGIKKENEKLQEENQLLLSQIVTLKETLGENQTIQEALQNTAADNVTTIFVNTIGIDSTSDSITLNRGLDDGIKKNMPVISSQKVLYGKIIEVYKNFSRAMLITGAQSVVDAKIQEDETITDPIHGAIKGQGNFSLYLDLVPSDKELAQGQIVVTSGLEGIFPKNLLIGNIISSDKNDAKPFQTAQIQPFLNIKNIDHLFVITNYLQK